MEHVPAFITTGLLEHILKYHKSITLCTNLFYVQKQAFFYTISKTTMYWSVSNIPSWHKPILLKEMSLVIWAYQKRGFEIVEVRANHELEYIKEGISPMNKNIAT